MVVLSTLCKFGAAVATILFAGGAIYINAAQYPALVDEGVDNSVKHFKLMYKRAAVWQASLAFIGGVLDFTNYSLSKEKEALIRGSLIFSVIPFTYAFIKPTNDTLIAEHTERKLDNKQAAKYLDGWWWLHGVRTVLSLTATFYHLYPFYFKQ
mmetsp:Transcript_62606/g.71823  ORF Transcript_62606/g.71823 Transcript_62606/m.71823 type:complete len:153 (-) Transcript_62606:248-706(-)|eukprot:CAMPEP_0114998548 /NCGR_PEP_ID=MMETSP0216-20121206/15574_1 /TAXON_ID=223996 /ORGANISM="Protocruzia adherens, Strain Boccale" /LENGTH=152 /DNA_ID=CAMNT_0002363169 /DNA_START=62 /DNA_END=520 /DNA_ORIENTATION=+